MDQKDILKLAEDIFQSVKTLPKPQATEISIAAEAFAMVMVKTTGPDVLRTIQTHVKRGIPPLIAAVTVGIVAGFSAGYTAALPGTSEILSIEQLTKSGLPIKELFESIRLGFSLEEAGLLDLSDKLDKDDDNDGESD